MPDNYDSLIAALESSPKSDLTIELVKEKLILEYKRKPENGDVQEHQVLKTNNNNLKFKKFRSKADSVF